jgi:hypothetical protein
VLLSIDAIAIRGGAAGGKILMSSASPPPMSEQPKAGQDLLSLVISFVPNTVAASSLFACVGSLLLYIHRAVSAHRRSIESRSKAIVAGDG